MADTPGATSAPLAPRAAFWTRVALGLIALAIGIGLIVAYASGGTATNDAYVTGHLHPVSARAAGVVLDVLVDDNQHVEAGQVIARLDPRDFTVRAELARAQIAQAEAQRLAAEAQTKQATAAIAASRATFERTQLDFARAQELIAQTPRGVSQQEFDAAKAARDAARAAVDGAQAQLAAAVANRAAAVAARDTGHANLDDAELALSYVAVVSPVAGRIGRKTVERGARVNVGQTLLDVVSDELWVVANFKEVQLHHLHVGQAVALEVDALPGAALHGIVDSVSPATGAQFSLLPPDNATGNFTKVVQRVPVKIRIDPAELRDLRERLVPGLSVVARPQDHDATFNAPRSAQR